MAFTTALRYHLHSLDSFFFLPDAITVDGSIMGDVAELILIVLLLCKLKKKLSVVFDTVNHGD